MVHFINKCKSLYNEHREIIVYLIMGVLATIVSWTCKFGWNWLFFAGTLYPSKVQNLILSIVNWVSGVTFAFFTNRKYVFQSSAPILPEAGKFISSRIATFFLDIVVMQVCTNLLGIDVYIATVISTIIITIANYILSKIIVFRDQQ